MNPSDSLAYVNVPSVFHDPRKLYNNCYTPTFSVVSPHSVQLPLKQRNHERSDDYCLDLDNILSADPSVPSASSDPLSQSGAKGGGGWGSSNSGEWKSRRNCPPKLPLGPPDDSPGGPFTATGKPMHIFSAEELDVLAEIETIMLSIRRIMHQSGLNDGDHLPVCDQSYVIENILNHHPDKASKIGAGVDFVTVKKQKHAQFGNHCFCVVSTDGQVTDFSYIECLQHFSIADSFCLKYLYLRKKPSQGNPEPSSPWLAI